MNRRVKYKAPLFTDGLTPVDALFVVPVPLPADVVAVELPPKPIMNNDESLRLQPDESSSNAAQMVSYVLRN